MGGTVIRQRKIQNDQQNLTYYIFIVPMAVPTEMV